MRLALLGLFGGYARTGTRSRRDRRPGLSARLLSVEPLEGRLLLSSGSGDHLWNHRENADDRFHDCGPWVRPWRTDYDDGVGRWVGEWSYDIPWGGTTTGGTSDGSFVRGYDRDHQVQIWTHVYVAQPKTITLTGGGGCGAWAFLNIDDDPGNLDQPRQLSASLELEQGWNRIDVTTFHQHEGFTFEVWSLATMVDAMNHEELLPPDIAVDNDPVVVNEGQTAVNSGTFSDPNGDPVVLAATVGLVVDNGDGVWGWTFDTTDGPIESQVVTIRATDDGGLWSEVPFGLVVNNVAPQFTDLAVTPAIWEDEVVTLTGTFTDPGTGDVHTLLIDWADGSDQVVVLPQGDRVFEVDHRYLDDGPSPGNGTLHDLYAIDVILRDDEGDQDAGDVETLVRNRRPEIVDFLGPDTGVPFQDLDFTVNVTDAGTLDVLTATFDWRDGSPLEEVKVVEGTAEASHAYITVGKRRPRVRVDDDDLGFDQTNKGVTITNAAVLPDPMVPGENALFVGGTSDADRIDLRPLKSGAVRVTIRSDALEPQPELAAVASVGKTTAAGKFTGVYDPSAGGHIYVFAGPGDDTVHLLSSVTRDAVVYAGAGDDVVRGGSGDDELNGADGDDGLYGFSGNDRLDGGDGDDRLFGYRGDDLLLAGLGNDLLHGHLGDDVLVGHAGNDRLYGSSGRDLLIGGLGTDVLFGSAGEDLLIGGATSHDTSDEALLAIFAEWLAERPISERIENLGNGGGLNGSFVLRKGDTVFDDEQEDWLYGASAEDWFLFFDTDRVKPGSKPLTAGPTTPRPR